MMTGRQEELITPIVTKVRRRTSKNFFQTTDCHTIHRRLYLVGVVQNLPYICA